MTTDAESMVRVDFTVLATSDVHGALSGFDAAATTREVGGGLTRIATKVEQIRKTADNCILVDNGDFLQGAAICDLAASGEMDDHPHNPIIHAMNHLNYDVVGLGNHEFDYGLPYLERCLKAANFPTISSNLSYVDQGWATHHLLDFNATDTLGKRHILRIGFLSVAPTQVVAWNKRHLKGALSAKPIVATAEKTAKRLKTLGADIVIALAHTGIEAINPDPDAENAAVPVAAIPGIDALVCGHSHGLFPLPGQLCNSVVDYVNGRLHDKPAVMPRFNASHLGQIELALDLTPEGWHVAQSTASVLPMVANDVQKHCVRQDPALLAKLSPFQTATRRKLNRVIGHIQQPIHSYFACLPGDPSCALTALAKLRFAESAFAGTKYETYPMLATSCPFRSGGRAGPNFYTDVKAGPVGRQNLYELHPFRNTACAKLMRGAQIKDWLEMSASCFARIAPGRRGHTIKNEACLGYNFDTIYGLSYEIDLTEPAKYDPQGREDSTAPGQRIKSLMWQGKPVDPDQEFILMTNSYRAGGGGNFPHATIAPDLEIPVKDLRNLVECTIAKGFSPKDLPDAPWQFTAVDDCDVIIESGQAALQHLANAPHLPLTPIGTTAQGFLQLSLDLTPKSPDGSLAIPKSSAYIS